MRKWKSERWDAEEERRGVAGNCELDEVGRLILLSAELAVSDGIRASRVAKERGTPRASPSPP
jgi:hypothetical protein